MTFWSRFLRSGFPGWFWAGVITTTAVVQEYRGELSTQFVSYAITALTVWLSYRWVSSGASKPVEKLEP